MMSNISREAGLEPRVYWDLFGRMIFAVIWRQPITQIEIDSKQLPAE